VLGMMLGVSCYTTVLGSVLSLVQSMDKQKQVYQDLVDSLNIYMEDHKLPKQLKTRLRRHFRNQETSNVLFDWSFVVDKMSHSLQEEVAEYTAHRWLSGSEWFKDINMECVNMLSARMTPKALSKGQHIFSPEQTAETLFIIKQGLAQWQGRICTRGKVLGDSMLHSCFRGTSTTYDDQATTMCFSVVYMLKIEELKECFARFPELKDMLYKRWVRSIFKQNVVAYAIAVNRHEDAEYCKLGRTTPVNSLLVDHYAGKLVLLDEYMEKVAGCSRLLVRMQACIRRFLAGRRVGRIRETKPQTESMEKRLERMETTFTVAFAQIQLALRDLDSRLPKSLNGIDELGKSVDVLADNVFVE